MARAEVPSECPGPQLRGAKAVGAGNRAGEPGSRCADQPTGRELGCTQANAAGWIAPAVEVPLSTRGEDGGRDPNAGRDHSDGDLGPACVHDRVYGAGGSGVQRATSHWAADRPAQSPDDGRYVPKDQRLPSGSRTVKSREP